MVRVGDDAERMTMLEGAPYTEETILTDLIGESNYVSMSDASEPLGLPYTDVQADDWFYDAVAFASKSGLMTGTSTTTFEPNTTTTRGMIVAILNRLEGSPTAASAGFVDVKDGDWYADAVNWAASVGVVNGMGEGLFAPNAAITREQMAAILYNYAAYKGYDISDRADISGYSDADQVSAWAGEAVQWAVAESLIAGVTIDTLDAQGSATRAQVAAIFQRFLSE